MDSAANAPMGTLQPKEPSCALCLPVIFFRCSELVQLTGEVSGESLRRKRLMGIFKSVCLFVCLWLRLNNKLKHNLAVDTDPGCPLMSFALTLCGQMSSSTSPPHFYSHWPHGTGITSPNITLLLWSHLLTVKPPLHQLPLAFLREPAARGQ